MDQNYLKERFNLDLDKCQVHTGEAAQDFLEKRMKSGSASAFAVKQSNDSLSLRKNGYGGDSSSFARRFGVNEYRQFANALGIEWKLEYDDRVLPHIASDERVDAHGDIVLQNWDFSVFKDNPAMPFNHEWDGLPVGIHLHWEVGNSITDRYNGPALYLLSLYATQEDNPLADSVFRLAKARFLRANSVGFYPKTVVVPKKEEAERLGMTEWGAILTDNLLLEDSPTLLGANDGALQILRRGRDIGVIQPVDLVAIRELARKQVENADDWVRVDNEYLELARMVYPDAKFFKHSDKDEPFDLQNEFFPVQKDQVSLLTQKVDSLTAYLQSSLSGMSVAIEDVRDMLTEMRSAMTSEEDSGMDTLVNGTTISANNQLIELFNERADTLLQKLEGVTRN